MSLLVSRLGRKQPRTTPAPEDGTGNGLFSIAVSDAGWRATLTDGADVRWQGEATLYPELGLASTAQSLQQAVAQLSAERVQTRIARVALLIDDAQLQLVDHRFAKLNNFEPRALKEFGAQQSGGKPVVFGSRSFGASSAREIERRALAFLPEESLESYFFALGKLAKALVCVRPATAPVLLRQIAEGGVFATLRVHGWFSTLLIGNADTGLIAMRQLPFGALTLAKSYAAEHGLSLQEAAVSMTARARLPAAAAIRNEAAPEFRTASFAALFPLLRQFNDDIAATIDYFRFQRMAGRPAHMSLAFTGPTLAGLDSFLADALDLQVEAETDVTPAEADLTALNLLEGSRPGLLKVGNQPYEFSGGQFVPMKGVRPDMAGAKSGGKIPKWGWLDDLVARANGTALAPARGRLMAGVAILGLAVLVIVANLELLILPAVNGMQDESATYKATVEASVGVPNSGGEGAAETRGPAVLWAENLLSVGEALLPPMRLTRLELAVPNGQPGAGAALAITGALPQQNPANLKLVAGFVDRLSKDESFVRRFGDVRFTGAADAADKEHPEMIFHAAAVAKGTAP